MAASNDDNVYIKVGKKYIPFGRRYNENYLPDGIWFVRHSDTSSNCTNADHYMQGLYKVGDSPGFVDIPKLCSMHSYTEYVISSPEFKELMNKGSYSFYELTAKIVALVIKLNETLKSESDDNNKRVKRSHSSL